MSPEHLSVRSALFNMLVAWKTLISPKTRVFRTCSLSKSEVCRKTLMSPVTFVSLSPSFFKRGVFSKTRMSPETISSRKRRRYSKPFISLKTAMSPLTLVEVRSTYLKPGAAFRCRRSPSQWVRHTSKCVKPGRLSTISMFPWTKADLKLIKLILGFPLNTPISPTTSVKARSILERSGMFFVTLISPESWVWHSTSSCSLESSRK
mmetsp:Transcript_40663/g.96990  ORF Transcript_40663/g.96990 Transcript_40663/m.96990 type:complete len:206 (-) Transcript_40663:665-1282(-)